MAFCEGNAIREVFGGKYSVGFSWCFFFPFETEVSVFRFSMPSCAFNFFLYHSLTLNILCPNFYIFLAQMAYKIRYDCASFYFSWVCVFYFSWTARVKVTFSWKLLRPSALHPSEWTLGPPRLSQCFLHFHHQSTVNCVHCSHLLTCLSSTGI